MKKKKLILIIAAFACLIFAATYTVFIQPLLQTEKWAYKENTVIRGNLTLGVTESGSLEYGVNSQTYDLNLTVSTDDDDDDDEEETTQKYLKVEEVYVASGQRISEGEAIVKFTQDSVSSVRKLLESALTDAQVAYSEAQSEYNLSLLQAKLNYQSEQVSGKYAKSIYTNSYQAVADSISESLVDIESLKNKRGSLQESYETAQENYQDALEAYETAKANLNNTDVSNIHIYVSTQTQYLNAKSQYESALSRMEQAEKSIASNEEQIESLEKQVNQASAKKSIEQMETKQTYESDLLTGEIAEVEYTAELESLKEELTEAEEELNEVKEQVEAFEEFVGLDGIVYAKGSGIVTEVGYAVGDTLVRSGNLVSYAPEANMTISVDVSQEDIITLEVGDSVKIEFSAYEDEIYEGVITSIVTTNTSDSSATVSYPVTISVLGDTAKLYGGMTANITFVTEEKEDVLYISKKAIIDENGKKYVYVDSAFGKKELKEVKTGLSNGVYIEITEGLEEGDTVYIASKVSNEADATNAEQVETSGAVTESSSQQTGGFGNWQGGDMPTSFPNMGGMP